MKISLISVKIVYAVCRNLEANVDYIEYVYRINGEKFELSSFLNPPIVNATIIF